MSRVPVRAVAATAVTAAVALTAVSSADAAPRHSAHHPAVNTVVHPAVHTAAHSRTSHVHRSRAASDARRLVAIKRQVARSAALKVRALTLRSARAGRAHLDTDALSAVRANIAADASVLTGYGKRVASAATISAALRARHLVATVRPALYVQAVALLAWDARTAPKLDGVNASISEVTRLADAKEADGADVTTAREAIVAATADTGTAATALAAAHAAAVTITATTPRRGVDSPVVVARVQAHHVVVALGHARAEVEQATDAVATAEVPAGDGGGTAEA